MMKLFELEVITSEGERKVEFAEGRNLKEACVDLRNMYEKYERKTCVVIYGAEVPEKNEPFCDVARSGGYCDCKRGACIGCEFREEDWLWRASGKSWQSWLNSKREN